MMKTTRHHVVRRATALLLTLALVGAAGVMDARAADPVPSSREARAFFFGWFPPVAPALLLKDERGRDYRTSGLRVESSRTCRRTRRDVRCNFGIALVRKPGVTWRFHDPIQCRGELRAARRHGRLVGRLGDYRCWTWTPPRP